MVRSRPRVFLTAIIDGDETDIDVESQLVSSSKESGIVDALIRRGAHGHGGREESR